MEENLSTIVSRGENSELKNHLNEGVAGLSLAPESHFRPHRCLNRNEGVKVIEEITKNPRTADTEFNIGDKLIDGGGGDLWLNVYFSVYLNNARAALTPRQTSLIVTNLPEESKRLVLEKVKKWYFKRILLDLQKGLSKITEQFETGDLLLADDYRNRIFDIHGRRSLDVPYTEWEIAGDLLFQCLVYGKNSVRGDLYGNLDFIVQGLEI